MNRRNAIPDPSIPGVTLPDVTLPDITLVPGSDTTVPDATDVPGTPPDGTSPDGTDPSATDANGSSATGDSSPADDTTSAEPPPEADLDVAAVAASLEVLAVNTYQAALDAAGSGALGEVPPAVAEFATAVQTHHQAALDAWNAVLTGAGREAVTAPPADLEATVNEEFAKITDVVGVAELARMLETIAADTYTGAIGTLQSDAAIGLAGSIQPIDRQHVAVLNFVLGEYPVPEVFATSAMAYAG